jgi:predicted ribosomally synthesized peptide with nif11-like leader
MSEQDLQAFRSHVEQTPELQQQLQSTTTKREFVDTATRLAGEHGYDVSEQEVQDFLDSEASPTRSLSDDQLESGVGRPESYTYSKPGCTSH